MNLKTWVLAGAAAVLLAAGSGQAQTADAPRMGFVEDRTAHRLHAMLGIPGAAHVGPAVELGEAVVPAAISPRGNYALIVAGDEQKPGIWTPQAKARPIEFAPAHPDNVVLSPEGAAAAFYYRNQNLLLIVSGLPDNAASAASIRLNPLEPAVRDMAVSDDAKLVITARAGSEPSVVVFNAAGEVNRIWLSGPASAIAFGSHSHDVVVAGASEAILIREADRPTKEIRLPAENLGVISAVALAPGGRRVFLAAPETAKAVIFRIEAANITSKALTCDCAPNTLARIGGGSGYRLTPYTGGVSWMLDISSQIPRILSVPPVSPEIQP